MIGLSFIYTLGGIVYAVERPDPRPELFGYHEVFHALVIVAVGLGGVVGLAAPQIDGGVALIWPPIGIALAALLRFGVGVWPGVFIGGLLVERLSWRWVFTVNVPLL